MSPFRLRLPLPLPLPLSFSLSHIAQPATRRATMRLNPLPLARPFSYTPPSQLPRKDAQHKDSINTEATEYSKSGTDDAAARQEGAAFDPESTRPEEEMEQAGKGHGEGANPLEVSPANGEVSRGTEGGVERSEEGVDGGGRKGSGFGRGGESG